MIDFTVKLFLKGEEKNLIEAAYLLNECCSKLENLDFECYYRIYDDGNKNIKINNP